MSATLLTTVSGRQVDLFAPRAQDIDFADIAEHLAKEARYNGATPGVVYSVAEHSCRGASAILAGRPGAPWHRDERRQVAGYFLLHDAPEAYLKDDTTPKKRALALVCERFGVLSATILDAFEQLTERFDAAIHVAAGLAWPPPAWIASMVHDFDRRMLVTEWRDLRPGHDLPAHYDAEPLPEKIEPWPWEQARDELMLNALQLLPALNGSRELAEAGPSATSNGGAARPSLVGEHPASAEPKAADA